MTGASIDVDPVDLALLTALQEDAKMSHKALAARAGLAPSSCWYRIQRLLERGVIRGFHADVDHRALGYQARALVTLHVGKEHEAAPSSIARRLCGLPGVQHLYVMNEKGELLIDVAARDVPALRQLIMRSASAEPAISTSRVGLVSATFRGAPRSA